MIFVLDSYGFPYNISLSFTIIISQRLPLLWDGVLELVCSYEDCGSILKMYKLFIFFLSFIYSRFCCLFYINVVYYFIFEYFGWFFLSLKQIKYNFQFHKFLVFISDIKKYYFIYPLLRAKFILNTFTFFKYIHIV